MIRYVAPNHFNHNYIDDFLRRFQRIFFLQNKLQQNVLFETGSVSQISSVGILLLYKIMEYTMKNRCFKEPQWSYDKIVETSLTKYGFIDLMEGIVKGMDQVKEAAEFRKIEVRLDDNFIIAPKPLVRNNGYTERILQDEYFPKVIEYYQDGATSEVIVNCISEILFNFYKHATEDEQSILVAEGNKSKIEISCADTGNGIVRTLKESIVEYQTMEPDFILRQAVKKRVTSKPSTNHMGRGLWMLDRAATITGGKLFIYSQGGSYKNDGGKVTSTKCGYWGGTAIYLNLPLNNPVSIEDVLAEELEDLNDINLNVI